MEKIAWHLSTQIDFLRLYMTIQYVHMIIIICFPSDSIIIFYYCLCVVPRWAKRKLYTTLTCVRNRSLKLFRKRVSPEKSYLVSIYYEMVISIFEDENIIRAPGVRLLIINARVLRLLSLSLFDRKRISTCTT